MVPGKRNYTSQKMPNRKGPEHSATKHDVGFLDIGNDGQWWKVKADKNGRHRWVIDGVKMYVKITAGWRKYLVDPVLREQFTREKYREFTKVGTFLYTLRGTSPFLHDYYVYMVSEKDVSIFKTKAKEVFGCVGLKVSFRSIIPEDIEKNRCFHSIIPVKTRKNIPGTYYIHGTQGHISFVIKVLKNKEIKIFKRLVTEESSYLYQTMVGGENKLADGDSIVEETKYFESTPCKVIKNAVNVFIGDSRHNIYCDVNESKGTSVLVQLPNNEYTYIHDEILSYKLPGVVTKFVGDHIDDDEPGPYAVDVNDRIYLFDRSSVSLLPRESMLLLGHPWSVVHEFRWGTRKDSGVDVIIRGRKN
jgi:hypothetical protein